MKGMPWIKRVMVAGSIMLVLMAVVGCSPFDRLKSQLSDETSGSKSLPGAQGPVEGEQTPVPTGQGPESAGQSVTVTLAAVGDVMGHIPEVKAAWNARTRTYDFTPMLAAVRNQVSAADIAVVNLETPLAGPGKGYSGFPRFNSPDALAQALKSTGFDVVTTANNHCLDKGVSGAVRTVTVLDKLGLTHTGTFKSASSSQQFLIRDVHGIKIGFLGYTYGTNGLTPPKSKSYLVNYAQRQAMLEDLKALREHGAEVTVVMLHFGNEYQRQPTSAQETLVDELIAGGADVILGSHPHVLQPVQIREVTRNGQKSTGLVAFSLGNFLSNQTQPYTDVGTILEVSLTRKAPGQPVELAGIKLTPTWVAQYRKDGKGYFEVQPLQSLLSGGTKPYLTPSLRNSLNTELTSATSHLTSRLQENSVPVIAPGLSLQ